jgi:hypothetical protein
VNTAESVARGREAVIQRRHHRFVGPEGTEAWRGGASCLQQHCYPACCLAIGSGKRRFEGEVCASSHALSGEVANYMAASANQNLASFPALLKILKIKNKDICFYFE